MMAVHAAWWILTASVLSGCVQPQLHARSSSGDDKHVIVGENISVTGRWYRTCTEDSFWSDSDPKEVECESRKARLQLQVSGPCHVVRQEQELADVTPTAPGVCHIDAVTTRLDNGKTDREIFDVQIDSADVDLYCFGEYLTWHRCPEHSISAMDPRLQFQVKVGEVWHGRDDVVINGTPVGTREVSLVDLYPDAKSGIGVRPGRYDVEVAYAGRSRRYTLDAR